MSRFLLVLFVLAAAAGVVVTYKQYGYDKADHQTTEIEEEKVSGWVFDLTAKVSGP